MEHTYYLLLASLVCPALSLHLPSYIKACSKNDPKLDECVAKNGMAAMPYFIHGDPKYGVPDLDPFLIEEMKIHQGTDQVGLNLVMTKFKLHGMKDSVLYKARVDLKNQHIEWYFKPKSLQLVGPYKASGKVLLLPIVGEGIANFTISDAIFIYKFDYSLQKRKGKEYIKVERTEFLHDIKGLVVKLDNLFNGDKLLGDNMNKFLNENWQELVNAFAPELVRALDVLFNRLLSSIMGLVPYDEVFPDT